MFYLIIRFQLFALERTSTDIRLSDEKTTLPTERIAESRLRIHETWIGRARDYKYNEERRKILPDAPDQQVVKSG